MWSRTVTDADLVITVNEDPSIGRRAQLCEDVTGLVRLHRPRSLMIVLEGAAEGSAAVSAILRVRCSIGLPITVVTGSAAVRRTLEANSGAGLVVQAGTSGPGGMAPTMAV